MVDNFSFYLVQKIHFERTDHDRKFRSNPEIPAFSSLIFAAVGMLERCMRTVVRAPVSEFKSNILIVNKMLFSAYLSELANWRVARTRVECVSGASVRV